MEDVRSFLQEPVENTETVCSICLDRVSNTTIDPCKHTEFCYCCISKVKENGNPCPLCRGPIQKIFPRVNPMERFRFVRAAEEGETACMICNDRVARATIAPCNDTGFCYPCIFYYDRKEMPCPCCNGPIERVEFDDFHPLKDLFGVMALCHWRSLAGQESTTLQDFADFFDGDTQSIARMFFTDWY